MLVLIRESLKSLLTSQNYLSPANSLKGLQLSQDICQRKMSSSNPNYPDAKVLTNPFRVEGEVVKGFGRGSKELNIPTGKLNFIMNKKILKKFRYYSNRCYETRQNLIVISY